MKPERGYRPLETETLSRHGLSIARYKGNFGNDAGGGVIVYKVYPEERSVVYSGLTSSGLSTINAAEMILEKIMNQEPLVHPAKFRFFDVQTIRGYEHYNRGSFEVTEINHKSNGAVEFGPCRAHAVIPRDFWPLFDILSNP